ncbi:MAG: phosphatidate cytidylyltransferase [Oscillospiraceae bacterium]|nr:phosphatidate cytidylyltransferase [Oscillospiraceae bacterium]
MKTRLLTAAALIPVLIVVVLFLPKLVMTLFLAAFSAIAAYELLYRTGLVRHMRLVTYSAVMAFLVPLWCYFGMPYVWGLLGLLVFIAALFAEMMGNHIRLQFEKIALCFVGGLLIPYLFAALIRILAPELGRHIIMIPFVLAFLPDSGAYFAGYFFGKHKLAPVISPKKTVEGAVGGVLTAVLGMLLYGLIMDLFFSLEVNYLFAVLYGIIVSLGDIFGDLMFSVIKRQAGIKDYGNLFPGHGGILDRFDSVMIVAPLTEVLLILLPVVVV